MFSNYGGGIISFDQVLAHWQHVEEELGADQIVFFPDMNEGGSDAPSPGDDQEMADSDTSEAPVSRSAWDLGSNLFAEATENMHNWVPGADGPTTIIISDASVRKGLNCRHQTTFVGLEAVLDKRAQALAAAESCPGGPGWILQFLRESLPQDVLEMDPPLQPSELVHRLHRQLYQSLPEFAAFPTDIGLLLPFWHHYSGVEDKYAPGGRMRGWYIEWGCRLATGPGPARSDSAFKFSVCWAGLPDNTRPGTRSAPGFIAHCITPDSCGEIEAVPKGLCIIPGTPSENPLNFDDCVTWPAVLNGARTHFLPPPTALADPQRFLETRAQHALAVKASLPLHLWEGLGRHFKWSSRHSAIDGGFFQEWGRSMDLLYLLVPPATLNKETFPDLYPCFHGGQDGGPLFDPRTQDVGGWEYTALSRRGPATDGRVFRLMLGWEGVAAHYPRALGVSRLPGGDVMDPEILRRAHFPNLSEEWTQAVKPNDEHRDAGDLEDGDVWGCNECFDSDDDVEDDEAPSHIRCTCGLPFQTRYDLGIHVSSISASLLFSHHEDLDRRQRVGAAIL